MGGGENNTPSYTSYLPHLYATFPPSLMACSSKIIDHKIRLDNIFEIYINFALLYGVTLNNCTGSILSSPPSLMACNWSRFPTKRQDTPDSATGLKSKDINWLIYNVDKIPMTSKFKIMKKKSCRSEKKLKQDCKNVSNRTKNTIYKLKVSNICISWG